MKRYADWSAAATMRLREDGLQLAKNYDRFLFGVFVYLVGVEQRRKRKFVPEPKFWFSP